MRREADRAAGPKLTCQVPVIRAARDDMKRLHGDPAAVWHGWASNVTGLPRLDTFSQCAHLFDTEVNVRRHDRERCASITCMIKHYVARRAQVTEGHPHDAAEWTLLW